MAKSPDRLLIGNRYLVPTSEPRGHLVPGTLESAAVAVSERLAYGTYLLEDGRRIIATTPLTDAELDEYRRDPDTFFDPGP